MPPAPRHCGLRVWATLTFILGIRSRIPNPIRSPQVRMSRWCVVCTLAPRRRAALGRGDRPRRSFPVMRYRMDYGMDYGRLSHVRSTVHRRASRAAHGAALVLVAHPPAPRRPRPRVARTHATSPNLRTSRPTGRILVTSVESRHLSCPRHSSVLTHFRAPVQPRDAVCRAPPVIHQ